MANYRAIAATGAALAGLIRDRYPRDEFGPGLTVALYQTRDFEEPMEGDGFSVYLFRVGVNATIRNRPPRRAPDGRRYRPSLPLDLYFMVTAWAQDVERQLRMLGWVMRLLEDVGVLSAGHLNHYLQENDTFGAHEAVELVCDPLSLSEYLTLWDRLRPKLPASATYTLRMVSLDSELPLAEGAPVQTRRFDMAQVVE
jgi:Pvc16 N-terminal domain